MEEKNTKQQDLIKTSPRQIVTLRNALGDTVRNYDLTSHNENAKKAHDDYCRRIYAKNKHVRKNIRTNGSGSGPIIIGNAEINNYFMEKIA